MDYVVSSDIHGNEYNVSLDELKWRPSAYGIVVKDDKILLTKQYGKYEVPGGGVDLGEAPEDAVVREVKEETGIDVAHPCLVKHLSGYFSHEEFGKMQHKQSLLLFFVCDHVGGDLSLDGLMEDERPVTEMAEWIPLSDLSSVESGSTFNWKSVVKEVLGLT